MTADPVFIVAQYKCGTSWLLRALSAHPDVLGISEIDVVKAVYDHDGPAAAAAPAETRLERFFTRSSWCPQDVRERIEDGDELPRHRPNFDRPQSIWDLDHKTIQELYRIVRDAEDPTEAMDAFLTAVSSDEADAAKLVLKAAAQVHVFDTLDAWRPGSRKLAITRDGRDAAISAARYTEFSKARPWFGGTAGYEELLQRWARGALAVADRARHGELFVIRYEDLTTDFAATMRRVLGYLDLDGSDEVLARMAEASSFEAVTGRPRGTVARSALRRGIVGEWKEALTADEADAAWRLIGDVLLHLGYERDGSTTPMWEAIHTRGRPGGYPPQGSGEASRSALLRQREALLARERALIRQRDGLASRRDALIRQRDALLRQRARLAEQRDDLVANAADLEDQRNVALAHRDEIAAVCDEITAHRDEVLAERDVAVTHRDHLERQLDEMRRHRDHVAADREVLRARVEELRRRLQRGWRARLRALLRRDSG